MHELSIAVALRDLVREKAPAGAAVRAVGVRVGPLRGIEPEAMQMGWRGATSDTDLAPARLDVEYLPWKLRCPDCNREWETPDLLVTCACGCDHPVPVGTSDELTLRWVEIDE